MCKLRMFGVWLKGDSNATYEKLARALATVGKRNIAEAMCTARGMAMLMSGSVCIHLWIVCDRQMIMLK